jgi:DNA polymerase
MIAYIDFETRSECDLPARGPYNYARHPSTQVLCMAYAIDDGEVELWTPDQPFPREILTHQIRAHNAAFERLILWYVLCPDLDLPEPALEQFYCTAAQARSNCAPGSLEDVGRFAGASMKKDHKGAALVRKCCLPPFKHTADDLAALFEYCKQDVRAMRAISKSLRELSPEELADYHVNERINDRGVKVDVELCHAAMRYSEAERVEIEARVVELTEGAVTSVRSPKMRQWVLERLGPEARKLARSKDKDSIDKTVRANLLAMENPDEVPPAVAEVIQCADDLWASSTAKFGRLASLADDEDQRVRQAALRHMERRSITSLGSPPKSPLNFDTPSFEATLSCLGSENGSPTP